MGNRKERGAAPGEREPLGKDFASGQRDLTRNRRLDQIDLSTRGLQAEFAHAVDNITPSWVDRLRGLGLWDVLLFGPPLVGVAKVTTGADGYFDFDDDGKAAIIIAEGTPQCPDWAPLEDLVAFKPSQPGRWWRRRGQVPLLGQYNIRPWRVSPFTIYETPMSWLRAGADGVVILDWRVDPAAVLSGAGPLASESGALRLRLHRRVAEVAVAALPIEVEEIRHAA